MPKPLNLTKPVLVVILASAVGPLQGGWRIHGSWAGRQISELRLHADDDLIVSFKEAPRAPKPPRPEYFLSFLEIMGFNGPKGGWRLSPSRAAIMKSVKVVVSQA